MKYVSSAKKVFLNTGTRFPRRIIWSIGIVKYAAAATNRELGLLEDDVGLAIEKASMELAEGKFDDQIIVDVFQTGSGTGLNMNANEVIAVRASELSGKNIHPNDHVNMGQSSNDVIPTVMRLAVIAEVNENLFPSLEGFIQTLKNLVKNNMDVVKPGRTHLRDALPITLGQELSGFSDAFEKHLDQLKKTLEILKELPLGGTAVGTGLNTHPEYPKKAVGKIREKTGINVKPANNRFRGMKLITDIVMVSSVLKAIAIDLWRLSQDLRLMYSGPFTGLNEIDIPQTIPGSSIMPGKVNPVTIEAAMQASAQVIGLDYSNSITGLLGEFELSMGLPLIGYNLITQISLLSEAIRKIDKLVLNQIKPNIERMKELAEKSQALITIISPIIGYDKATQVSKLLYEGKSIREALKQLGFDEKQIAKLLDLNKLSKIWYSSKE